MNRPTRPSAPWRGPRGAVVGSLAWSTVLFAHAAASGALPSVGASAVTGGLAALVGVAFAGPRFTWRRSFVVLLLLQPLLHVALATIGAGAHHRHALGAASPSWAMAAAHVVAAALAAWWVTTGDRLLLSAAGSVGARLGVRTTPSASRIEWLALSLAREPESAAPVRHLVLLGSMTRRGPPQVCTG